MVLDRSGDVQVTAFYPGLTHVPAGGGGGGGVGIRSISTRVCEVSWGSSNCYHGIFLVAVKT